MEGGKHEVQGPLRTLRVCMSGGQRSHETGGRLRLLLPCACQLAGSAVAQLAQVLGPAGPRWVGDLNT